jgi:pimeloyl-ACP methyl ester carboxylesterase
MKSAPPIDSLYSVTIPAGGVMLEGDLQIPSVAEGVVIFAHGSGSGRHSPRNQFVARIIREAGMGTLLFDLLTKKEEVQDDFTHALRFDINLLARRLVHAARWLTSLPDARPPQIAFFGASTGAAAALCAAAQFGNQVRAVVSRGGRPDLADAALDRVVSPTLLIVGESDHEVLGLNRKALNRLRCEKELRTIPEATHLFEEPGTLEQAAQLAASWFRRHFSNDAEKGGLR